MDKEHIARKIVNHLILEDKIRVTPLDIPDKTDGETLRRHLSLQRDVLIQSVIQIIDDTNPVTIKIIKEFNMRTQALSGGIIAYLTNNNYIDKSLTTDDKQIISSHIKALAKKHETSDIQFNKYIEHYNDLIDEMEGFRQHFDQALREKTQVITNEELKQVIFLTLRRFPIEHIRQSAYNIINLVAEVAETMLECDINILEKAKSFTDIEKYTNHDSSTKQCMGATKNHETHS